MRTTKKKAALSKLVQTVLSLHEMSLNFRVELTPKEAAEWAENFQTYNRIGDLPGLIAALDARIPRMNFGLLNGEPNPNNGGTHHKYIVGNEGSLVIYLSLVHAYLKHDEIPKLVADIETIAKAAGADEFNPEQTFGSTDVRMWWD